MVATKAKVFNLHYSEASTVSISTTILAEKQVSSFFEGGGGGGWNFRELVKYPDLLEGHQDGQSHQENSVVWLLTPPTGKHFQLTRLQSKKKKKRS